MTTFDDFDEWFSSVFSEHEINKLRQQAEDVLAEVEAENEEPPEVSVEIVVQRNAAKDIVAWLREQHAEYAEGAASDFVWAAGVNICFAYLVDGDWEYDEEMSDHATYFGARDWFVEDGDD